MQTKKFGNDKSGYYDVYVGGMKFVVSTWDNWHKNGPVHEWKAHISLTNSQGYDYHPVYTSKDYWATEADARYTAEKLLAGALKNLIEEWEEGRIDGCTGVRKDGGWNANVNF